MIYRLDDQIAQALETAYDPETGELLVSEEEMFSQIEQLKADFDTMIDSIASSVKNLKAEAQDVKDEKMKLEKRQHQLEAKADRSKRLLAYLLHGESWKNARHKIGYRSSSECVIDDGFIEWAISNGRQDLLNTEPTVRKADVKAALKRGEVFEFARLESKDNIQVM